MSLVLVVPYLPHSINDWRRGAGHFRERTAERDRWRAIIRGYAYEQRLKPLLGPVSVAMTFHWGERKRRDPDNFAKSVLDALVYAGLIQDDGPPWLVDLLLGSRWDRLEPRTEIRVESAIAPAWEPLERKVVKRASVIGKAVRRKLDPRLDRKNRKEGGTDATRQR